MNQKDVFSNSLGQPLVKGLFKLKGVATHQLRTTDLETLAPLLVLSPGPWEGFDPPPSFGSLTCPLEVSSGALCLSGKQQTSTSGVDSRKISLTGKPDLYLSSASTAKSFPCCYVYPVVALLEAGEQLGYKF